MQVLNTMSVSYTHLFENYANFVVNNLNREAGGIGAYHINADSFDKNEYRYVRNAISIMNPPIK